MNKSFYPIFFTSLFLLTTSVTYAAGLVPCGGPNEAMCRACDFVAMGQNIMKWFVLVSASIVALMFAFGGMKMVMSAGNTGAVSEGKEMMTNSVIGFLILLAAWLIVNTVLMTFMKDGNGIAVWGTIQCVDNPAMSATTNTGGGTVTNTGGGGTGSGAQCAAGNTACSVAALAGAGFNAVQANIMSCIAMTESSGNASIPPYNQTHPGSNSSACGLFQVTRTTWSTAATGACADFSNCTNAACNTAVAKTLVSKNGYRDWTCPGCNTKAQGCIDKYGG